MTIEGAGWAGAEFKTVIAKVVKDADPAVSGNVYLTYPAVTTMTNTNVAVAGNPSSPEAPYFTRAQIALVAKGMHSGSPLTARIAYTRSLSKFTFSVKDSLCTNTPCASAWNFGDGKSGTGTPVTHDYGSATGNYPVALAVTDAIGASSAPAARPPRRSPLLPTAPSSREPRESRPARLTMRGSPGSSSTSTGS